KTGRRVYSQTAAERPDRTNPGDTRRYRPRLANVHRGGLGNVERCLAGGRRLRHLEFVPDEPGRTPQTVGHFESAGCHASPSDLASTARSDAPGTSWHDSWLRWRLGTIARAAPHDDAIAGCRPP